MHRATQDRTRPTYQEGNQMPPSPELLADVELLERAPRRSPAGSHESSPQQRLCACLPLAIRCIAWKNSTHLRPPQSLAANLVASGLTLERDPQQGRYPRKRGLRIEAHCANRTENLRHYIFDTGNGKGGQAQTKEAECRTHLNIKWVHDNTPLRKGEAGNDFKHVIVLPCSQVHISRTEEGVIFAQPAWNRQGVDPFGVGSGRN